MNMIRYNKNTISSRRRKKLIFLLPFLILLFLPISVEGATTIYSCVCTNAYWGSPDWAGQGSEAARDARYGTRHYTSLNAWESARDRNLVTADEIEVCEIVGDDWTSPDTTRVNITDWTTDSTRYIVIKTVGDAYHNGIAGSGYVMDPSSNGEAIEVFESYTRIEGIEITDAVSGGWGQAAIYINGATDVTIDKVLIHDCLPGSYDMYGLTFWNGGGKVTNSIFYNGPSNSAAIRHDSSAALYVYNTTEYNFDAGIERASTGTVTVKNCAVFGNSGTGDDFVGGTMTIDYCASDDGDGTNARQPSDWSAVFVDYTSGNFHLKSTDTDLKDWGTDLLSEGGFSDDIDGETRSGTWDIGADECLAGISNQISNPVSDVSPGWSNNRKRAVFYNGDRFFLLYYKGGSILYYQSSTDNVTWSGESTLMSGPTSVFDIYLVSDTKFDLVYRNSTNYHYVATCTISGATITAGSSSATWATGVGSPEVVVARSGGGDRIYVASGAGDTLRIYSADQTGDAENVTSWNQELSAKESPEDIAMVPYQNSDQVLVIHSEFKNDGMYSQLVTYDSGRSEVEIGDFNNLPDFSSPIRISDDDIRIIIRPPGAAMEEWKWDGSAWSEVETVDAETDQDTPSLFYDRISGDMYAFSIDTGSDDVERHKKLSGGSWQDQPEEIADDGELTTHTFPITQMHEPPYGSSRSVPSVLVWAYRVGTSPYDLKVGALGLAPEISSDADQEFEVGQVATEISKITITEPGAPTITDTYDLRIAIDPGVDMVWDTSVTTATFGGTGSGNVSNPVSYDPSGRVLIIPVGTAFAALQTLTIEGLYFTNFATANPAKPGLKVFLGGAGDTVAESWDVKTIMIKGAVTLGNHTQGQVGDKFTGETESQTTTEYFRFQLENNGEPASTTLTVDLSSINGIVTGDITDVQLWADVDGLGDVTAADAAGVWTTYDKSPVTSMFSLTFDSANNVLYAGASNGTIYRCDTSTGCDENGDWTVSYPTTENQIRSVFYDSANNAIYAGSNNGGIIYRCDTASGCDEVDGSEWVECYDTSAVSIYAFTLDSANNVIYAASSEIGAATIYRCDASTGCDDASEWTISHSTTLTTIYSLTFDSVNNVLYAGTSNNGIIYRCDTSTGCDEVSDWTISYDTPATSIYSLTFDSTNKILYAGSTDGIIYRCDPSTGCDQGSTDWTTAFTTGEFSVWSFTLDTINNVLYAGTGGSTKIFSCDTSTGCDDGASEWLLNYDPSVGGNIYSLAFDSTHDVITASTSGGKISRRFEGDYRMGGGNFLWTERTAANGYTNWFRGVAHDGTGLWVAVGTDGEIQSWDGMAATWTKETPAASYSNYFEAVAHNGLSGASGLWVAVGMDGEIQSSTDGSTWIEQTIEGTFSNVFNGIAHNGLADPNDLWVAVGSQGEIQSWNGDDPTWTKQTPDASYGGSFFGVVHNGLSGASGLWVAVGMSGEIQSSTDGSTWTQEATGGTNFYEVAYDGTGLWVAVGSGGKIWTSPDGSSWTARTADAGYTDAFNGVAYDPGSGLWTAVGVGGEIQTSPNGIDWTRRYPAGGYTDSFKGVAHGAGLWTAVGVGGEIQTSCGLICGGPVSISGSAGTITFDEAPLPSGSMDYLLRATISNIVDGDTITFGLDAAGVAAIGQVSGQSLSDSGSATSRTHTRGIAGPYLTQIHYRWRHDNGGEAGATWPVNEDTALSILSVNTQMRLRFEISNEGSDNSLSTEYLLEYATSTDGPWEAVPVSATTEHWEMVNSTYFTDGASTSNIVPGLSDENADFAPGKLKDTSNQTAGIILTATEFTEIEYCIGPTANVTPPETYYFRLTNAGTPLDSYSIYGRVIVGNSGPWFDSNWPYRKLLRIDSSRVAGDLANFPVLINTTDENLIFSGSQHAVNHVRKSNGGDIVFTTELGIKLDHEIEEYNSSTGELVAWVEVPSVSGSSDTFIYIYYGYSGAPDQWNVNGTWDEEGDNYYEGVWHLNESPNDGVAGHVDSTGNLNVGTPQNFQDGGGGTTDAAGKIGGADSFAGDDDEVLLSNEIIGSNAQWTLTAWIKTASSVKQTIYGEGNLSTGNYLYIDKNSSSYVEFYLENDPEGWPWFSGTKNVEDNEWHHVAIVQTSQIYRELFVDGLSDGPPNSDDGGTPTHDTASIGLLRTQGWTADPFEGIIDEVRVSHTPRTAAWIATEYNNQRSPAAFYTVGIEETEGTGGDPFQNGWSYRKQITILASEVPSDQTNFPVLIKRTSDADLTGIQADFGDILFMASDATIKLDHEIEDYNSSTGDLVAWVEVRSLSGSVDTVIYLYYGNSDAVDQENPTGAGVWEPNYRGVWHLSEPSGNAKDSTWHGTEGTPSGTVTYGSTGRIDGAYDFGTDGEVDAGYPADEHLDFGTASFTYGAWINVDQSTATWQRLFYKGGSSSTVTGYGLETNQTATQVYGMISDGTSNIDTWDIDISLDTWTYVVVVVDRSAQKFRIYKDGIEQGTAPDISGLVSLSSTRSAQFPQGSGSYDLDGLLDEVRVSSGIRSPDWILTEHNNQKISSSFYTVGDECDGSATEFSYRRSITINAGQVSNTEAPDYLTDFPVLVSLSHATLKNTVNGGYVQHSQGYDIIFRDSTGTTQLDHEIEEYDGNNGILIAWVRVPTLSKTSNTVINMYYGNCGISSRTENPADVWDLNYAGVWHLHETPSHLGTHDDSSRNRNTGTWNDSNSLGDTNATGKIDGADDFDGADDYVQVNDSASLDITQDITLSSWIFSKGAQVQYAKVVSKFKGAGEYPYQLCFQNATTDEIYFSLDDGTSVNHLKSTADIPQNEWTHVAGTYDGITMRLYINGTEDNTDPQSISIPTNNEVLTIGGRSGASHTLIGIIDEVRISNTARPFDWIKTSYTNQNNPGNIDTPGFYTVGNEEYPAPTAVDLISLTATGYDDTVHVEWETAQEINNLGFNLYRSTESNGSYTKLNNQLIPGLISAVSGQQYIYSDKDVIRGVLYYYMLEDVDLSGMRTMHGPVCVDWDGDGIPDDYVEEPDDDDSDTDNDDSDPEVRIPDLEFYEVDFDPEGWTPSSNIGSETWVELASFRASQEDEGVSLEWETSYEADNLGFHVYREQDGRFYRITENLVPGSVFKAGVGRALPAGQHYVYWDGLSACTGQELYWLDCVEVNGGRASFGPIKAEVYGQPIPERLKSRFKSIAERQVSRAEALWKIRGLRDELSARSAQRQKSQGIFYQTFPKKPSKPRLPPSEEQWVLSAQPGVKISVKEEGWYRVGEPELVAAGLDPGVDPRYLQLYADGQEQSMMVTGSEDGRFDPEDFIEFYGTGLDTSYSDTRVYWLVVGERAGQRLDTPFPDIRLSLGKQMLISRGPRGRASPLSFPFSVELKERTFYFAALKNGEEESFFGAVVSPEPVDQLISATHPDPSPPEDAMLEVVLQGGTDFTHQVKILFNNVEVGEVVFSGQERGAVEIQIPKDLLLEGDNIVTLEAQGGSMDVSLVDHIRLTYWHTYTADEDVLKFTAMRRELVSVEGFSSPEIQVVDITDPIWMFNVRGMVKSQGSGYAVTFKVPGHGQRILMAFAEENIKEASGIAANLASSWHERGQGADVVIIAHRDLFDSVRPLKELREQQGWTVALVDVEDLYDEFNFGSKSPWALREFLSRAYDSWNPQPRFVLLVGDASYDPHNYLGFGDFDQVPTKLVDTQYLKTASDDWFVDFNDDGLPEMAVGRLPVESALEAVTVVSKIISYDGVAGLMNEALLVADSNDVFDFEGACGEVRSLLPADMTVSEIFRGQSPTARTDLLDLLNQGQLLVNYFGHGSTTIWKGNLLTSLDAWSLNNSPYLPFFVSMTCLNGFFQDPYSESMAETFLKAGWGGAVAVWTSSGLTDPGGQVPMNKELIQLLFNGQGLTIGEAIMGAKRAAANSDVRRTWILFGDPTLRLR